MQSILESIRDYLGAADGWWQHFQSTNNMGTYQWDYAAMFEYFFAGVLLCIVVSYVFRIILKMFD